MYIIKNNSKPILTKPGRDFIKADKIARIPFVALNDRRTCPNRTNLITRSNVGVIGIEKYSFIIE